MILGDHENSENSMKRKIPNALSAAQKREGREPEQCIKCNKGLHGECFPNEGANCKRYVCTVLDM
jgi:hypothetical protein